MVERFYPTNTDEIFKPLQLIRHTLMHGGRIASLADKLPGNPQQAVNIMAFVSWQALLLMFEKIPSGHERPISVGYKDQFVRRTVVATADMTVRMPGDPNNPKIEDLPAVNFKVEHAPTQSNASSVK